MHPVYTAFVVFCTLMHQLVKYHHLLPFIFLLALLSSEGSCIRSHRSEKCDSGLFCTFQSVPPKEGTRHSFSFEVDPSTKYVRSVRATAERVGPCRVTLLFLTIINEHMVFGIQRTCMTRRISVCTTDLQQCVNKIIPALQVQVIRHSVTACFQRLGVTK